MLWERAEVIRSTLMSATGSFQSHWTRPRSAASSSLAAGGDMLHLGSALLDPRLLLGLRMSSVALTVQRGSELPGGLAGLVHPVSVSKPLVTGGSGPHVGCQSVTKLNSVDPGLPTAALCFRGGSLSAGSGR